MRIEVFTDLRFTDSLTPTGVGKHIAKMVRGLVADGGHDVKILGAKDQMAGGRIPATNALSGISGTVLPLRWKTAEALWVGFGRPYADRWLSGADWVYCPKNDFIPVRNAKLAVTIHGAAELDPGMPRPRTLYGRVNRVRRQVAYRRMVARADAVLTVSGFLKGQIVDWFQADPAKVYVVGNGVEREYFETGSERNGPSDASRPRQSILCIGGLNFLDGGDRILKIAEHLLQAMPDVDVLVAGIQHEPELLDEARRLSNLKLLGYVEAPRLAAYLRDALAFVYPTRYETFGIAAAEAMAVGAPVVTCHCTAVPEIVAEAGIYVNMEKPVEVVQSILNLRSNKELRSKCIARGKSRACAYTWEACVGRLRSVLEGLNCE